MGVYIKGMKVPKACVYRDNGHLMTCPLYDIDGYCGVLNHEANHKEDDRSKDCPLIPVPDHGDLIDRQALFDAVYKAYGIEADDSDCNILMEMILNAPAIIPGNKED